VRASTVVPGAVADAEALWYDRHRWPSWIDGFGHVVRLEGDWPRAGARLLWESRPGGRGLVNERVTIYEPGHVQTLDVEDERLQAAQVVFFEPAGAESVRVTLELDYRLKRRFTPLLVRVFTRRALRESLQRTLARFARERQGDVY
jgi:Polyketide cyclase / dehydrase and lipid transport